MKKLLLITFAVLSVAFLGSCSDNSPTEPVEKPSDFKSFLSVGNWWKYEEYEVNEDGNKTDDATRIHTTSIIGKSTIGEKEAFIQVEQYNEYNDTSYVYENEEGVFAYYEFDDLEEVASWHKVIDYKNSYWDIIKDEINEVEDGVTTKGIDGLKGQRVGTHKAEYKGNTYDIQDYMQIVYSDITTSYIDDNGKLITHEEHESDTARISIIPAIGIFSTTGAKSVELIDGKVVFTQDKTILIDHYVK